MPEDILSRQAMQAVLWDLVRAGEFLDAYAYKDSSTDKGSHGAQWYAQIYKLHHITEAQFKKSYAYYKEHPALMKEVLDSLSKIKSPDHKLTDSTALKKDSTTKTDAGSIVPGSLNQPNPLPRKYSFPVKPKVTSQKTGRRLIDSLKNKDARRLPG